MVNDYFAHSQDSPFASDLDVAGSSVKHCSVTLFDVIAKGKRLEASVFDVDARQARAAVEHGKYPVTTIGGTDGLATPYMCERFKRIWVTKSVFPILQPSSITDIYPQPDGYISKKTQTDIDALRARLGQLLMTRSGTIGKLTYVSRTLDNNILSDDLLRITCKNPTDAGYIYTYLKCATGNKILSTNNYGAVITHIEPEHLAAVPIPDAPSSIKARINDLIVASYELRDTSNDLIDEATRMLAEELRLPDISDFDVALFRKNAGVDTFSVRLRQLAGRADASYHVPIVNAIVEKMRENASEITTIGDPRISRKVILPGRFKRIYVGKGYGRVFIGGKQLHELDPSNKKYLSIQHHGNRIAEQLELHEGMTLITCSGTIGKVTLVGKHWEKWTASQHIIRIVPANSDVAGYISIFLASDYGRHLITRHIYGAVVDEIDDTHVSSIPIPIMKNKGVQNKINSLALLASEKRLEAFRLEQQALEIMDKEVIFAK